MGGGGEAERGCSEGSWGEESLSSGPGRGTFIIGRMIQSRHYIVFRAWEQRKSQEPELQKREKGLCYVKTQLSKGRHCGSWRPYSEENREGRHRTW